MKKIILTKSKSVIDNEIQSLIKTSLKYGGETIKDSSGRYSFKLLEGFPEEHRVRVLINCEKHTFDADYIFQDADEEPKIQCEPCQITFDFGVRFNGVERRKYKEPPREQRKRYGSSFDLQKYETEVPQKAEFLAERFQANRSKILFRKNCLEQLERLYTLLFEQQNYPAYQKAFYSTESKYTTYADAQDALKKFSTLFHYVTLILREREKFPQLENTSKFLSGIDHLRQGHFIEACNDLNNTLEETSHKARRRVLERILNKWIGIVKKALYLKYYFQIALVQNQMEVFSLEREYDHAIRIYQQYAEDLKKINASPYVSLIKESKKALRKTYLLIQEGRFYHHWNMGIYYYGKKEYLQAKQYFQLASQTASAGFLDPQLVSSFKVKLFSSIRECNAYLAPAPALTPTPVPKKYGHPSWHTSQNHSVKKKISPPLGSSSPKKRSTSVRPPETVKVGAPKECQSVSIEYDQAVIRQQFSEMYREFKKILQTSQLPNLDYTKVFQLYLDFFNRKYGRLASDITKNQFKDYIEDSLEIDPDLEAILENIDGLEEIPPDFNEKKRTRSQSGNRSAVVGALKSRVPSRSIEASVPPNKYDKLVKKCHTLTADGKNRVKLDLLIAGVSREQFCTYMKQIEPLPPEIFTDEALFCDYLANLLKIAIKRVDFSQFATMIKNCWKYSARFAEEAPLESLLMLMMMPDRIPGKTYPITCSADLANYINILNTEILFLRPSKESLRSYIRQLRKKDLLTKAQQQRFERIIGPFEKYSG